MTDIQTICAAIVMAVVIICMTIQESYKLYLNHNMPIAENKQSK